MRIWSVYLINSDGNDGDSGDGSDNACCYNRHICGAGNFYNCAWHTGVYSAVFYSNSGILDNYTHRNSECGMVDNSKRDIRNSDGNNTADNIRTRH